MLKRLAPFFFLVALPGCPYTDGCAVLEAPLSSLDGTDPETEESVPTDEASAESRSEEQPTGKGAQLDFGAEPSGGPALSALSCPELSMPLARATTYVDVNANTGATRFEDGSRSAPFRSIAKAFAAAPVKGVIYVAAGMYKENLKIPNKDLSVFGGFNPTFTSRTDACATVIESGIARRAVFTAPADVLSFTFEGFTVQRSARAFAIGGDATLEPQYTIARSVFLDNGLNNEVGGAIALDGVNARVFRSVFRDNHAGKGAALAAGGDAEITIDQNVFERNLGYSDHGGGVYLSTRHAKVTRNTFRGNATGIGINGGDGGGWGGALIVYNNSDSEPAKADLSFNVFTENTAGIGGAVFVDEGATLTMSHDLLYRNRAYSENRHIRGAAIYVDGTGAPGGGSTFTGEYLTVVNNLYDDKGDLRPAEEGVGGDLYVEGWSKATVTSSIFWNNGEHEMYVENGSEINVSSSIANTPCTSANAEGFITASATICKVGAGVFHPEEIHFGDEDADDYHEKSKTGRFSKGAWVKDNVSSPAIGLGAFAKTPEASKP